MQIRMNKLLIILTILLVCLGVPRAVQAQINNTINNFDEEIIYIDGDGRIRVIDTNQTGPTLVDWESPDVSFTDFAVGDFNADGDYEIVGIKGGAGGPLIVIYDPVILPGTLTGTDRTDNGIHWEELYRSPLGAPPILIETGDFDPDTPGDEIVYVLQIGAIASNVFIIKRDLSLPTESINNAARTWTPFVSSGNFPRVWQHIEIGQIDEMGADEIVLTDGTREPEDDDGIRSKIAAFRVDDGGLASRTPFFERENAATSWRFAEIAEMNGRAGAEIIATRSSANLLPNLFIFEYDMQRRTIRDLGDGCPDEPHESLSCPDDVFSLRLAPSPKWTFAADVNGNGQEEAFFLRNVINNQNPIRLFGLDFLETFTFNITPNLSARATLNNVTTVYTVTNVLNVSTNYTGEITFSDGRMIARDETTTHWATYYDIDELDDFPARNNSVELYNLWQRGAGGDTDGDGIDEVVAMRTDNIRTYAYNPTDPVNWSERRDDLVATNNRSIKLANLDRNGTLLFAPALDANSAYTFVSFPCAAETIPTATVQPYEIEINASQPTHFEAFATLARTAPLLQQPKNGHTLPRKLNVASAPTVDWPSGVPWLTLSSPEDVTNTTLTVELVPTGLTPGVPYQEAQLYVQPLGLGTEYGRELTVGFLCANSQTYLPILVK